MALQASTFFWICWWLGAIGITVWLSSRLFGDDARVFLPGDTTHGHYQIELSCASCHAPDGGVNEQSCIDCHQADLDAVNDSHPKKKFKDIRKAHLLEDIDAMNCITCHQEHVPDRTHEMGLTIPPDYCVHCHEDIGEERPTHAGLEFETCTTAGCHNYHDNSALYYEFLKKHAHAEDFSANPHVPTRDFADRWRAKLGDQAQPLTASAAPTGHDGALVADWASTAHGLAGVDCASCHSQSGEWKDQLDHTDCQSCHQHEVEGWLSGLHGMRVAAELAPMTPGEARLPMHNAVHAEALDCTSCHTAHRFDTQFAAVDACLQCHNDQHSTAYLNSAHFRSWQDEIHGSGPAGSGVSCATCHMPRVEHKIGGGKTEIRVEHNQSKYLSPNEKMIRTSCMHCHGVGFAIDALADENLIQSNFDQHPTKHIPSIDWVLDHEQRTARPPKQSGSK